MPTDYALHTQSDAKPASRRRREIFYRTGLITQVLGSALLAVLYPLENPFYTAGIMLFEIGVLLSAAYFLVSIPALKKITLTSVLIGLITQISGYVAAPAESAGSIMIFGIALVCLGAAGMAAKEAYCFRYREGLVIAISLPVIGIVNLWKGHHIFNSASFSLLFLLLLSLTGKKLSQPLLSPCTADIDRTSQPSAGCR